MKVADVLVERNGRVAPMSKMPGTRDESTAIVDKHQRLWGVGVYTHPTVARDHWKSLAVLAWLRDEMDLGFVDKDGSPIPTVADLLAERLASSSLRLPVAARENIQKAAQTSGRGSADTFDARLRRTFEQSVSVGYISADATYPFD